MSIERLPPFRDDGLLNVVVETPRGSAIKIKFDPSTGCMMLSRPLPLGFVYPYDWGFVPGTRAPDGDAVDAIVLWDRSSVSGLLVPSRAIGALRVEQSEPAGGRGRNDRLVVVPLKTPTLDHVKSVDDLPDRVRTELEHFLSAVVAFENKQIRLLGWGGPADAERFVRSATG